MHRNICRLLVVFMLLLFSAFPSWSEESAGKTARKEPKWIEGEVLVTFRNTSGSESLSTMAASVHGASVKTYGTLSKATGKTVAFLRVPGKSTEELLEQLSLDPKVESVSPNYILPRIMLS